MPLPASWIDHLFAKLSVRYGAAFMRQYTDLDPALVKADWSDLLGGCDGPSLGYALRYLPTDRPPNAMQFRDICRRAPVPELVALPAVESVIDPQRVRALIEQALCGDGRAPADRVLQRLREIERTGRLSAAQRAQLEAIELRGSVSTNAGGVFTAIPADCLPPAMRIQAVTA